MSEKSDLTKIAPPKELSDADCRVVFQRLSRRLASFRNTAELYATMEASLTNTATSVRTKNAFVDALNTWAQETLNNIWYACREPGGGKPPQLDPLSDTSTAGLPPLPSQEYLTRILHTILLLHVTSSKGYSSRTRAFISTIGPVDEEVIAATLKNPQKAIEEAGKKTDAAREEHAKRNKMLRMAGMGVGAVAGGVLVGVTGGLAAPAVGAAAGTVLGWLGIGGTAVGMLATGLAGSSVVCGALFGAYGSKKTAAVIGEYTREVRDLAIQPVRPPKETMAVRLCVTGWLESPEDVTAPWTVFEGDDTFALQWEVEALQKLSNALLDLVKAQAMQYIKGEIIKKTFLAALFSALSPTAWLKITKIIDNPWVHTRTLAVKTGKVLGTLLAERVLGNRPITLVGYSLGSLVIFEALQYLASLPPSQTLGLVQDVYLFGSPLPTDRAQWAAIRRVAAGRVVNGYGSNDYVLAVLARVSGMKWGVAGLEQVEVQGIENVACDEVDGHLKWRGLIGQCLAKCNIPGIDKAEVQKQLESKATEIGEEVDRE
ncbi:DUF726-domain-containing protein [Trametes coccinea BRFM310]|uniref:DUF726-domain-containing protein n=1 Tax=Trametes coccinea (strain BRFM310) TaxID=1353009 RepID=A0A1Y2IMR6_TRAC3|nr:DUF726-domain-containing protein [Trametes coccinea BRFM310]